MKYNKSRVLTKDNWKEFDNNNNRVIMNRLRCATFTSDLTTNINEFFYFLKHDIKEVPLCYCGNRLKFLGLANGHRKFCSNSCSKLSKSTQKKFEETMLSRYNKTSYLGDSEVRAKMKETLLYRYGVDHPAKHAGIKAKMRATTLERYGVEHNFQGTRFYSDSRKKHELSGRWLPLKDKNDFDVYKQLVIKFTKRNDISTLPNFDKRGRAGVDGAYHLDHKISIKEGFRLGILPSIIGNINNLEFIPYLDNLLKSYSSSITPEELFNLIECSARSD